MTIVFFPGLAKVWVKLLDLYFTNCCLRMIHRIASSLRNDLPRILVERAPTEPALRDVMCPATYYRTSIRIADLLGAQVGPIGRYLQWG